MPDALGSFTVTLDDIEVTCIADPEKIDAELDPAFSGSYQALDSTKNLERRDVPLTHLNRFSRGMNVVSRKDAADDGGYAWGEDVITWLDDGVTPSGRRTAVGAGLGIGAGVVRDSVVFGGDLYAICYEKFGVKFLNANPTNAPTFSPALNFAGDATASYRSGYLPKAITTFWTYLDGAGAYLAGGTKHACIIVSTYNGGTGATRLYQYTAAFGWKEGAADLGYRADSMATVWWEGTNGTGAYRLLIQADDTTIRHCIQSSDPLAGASYVTPIEVAEPGYFVNKIVAAGGHAYAKTTGGLVDFSEIRTWPITPYWKEQSSYSLGNAAMIYDKYLYAARGFGLDRFDVRLSEGEEAQPLPGECGPSAFGQDGTPITGYVTALAQHSGWLIAAVYNPNSQTSYVCRAKDRRSLDVAVASPLVWHGAEQVLAGTQSIIQHLRITPDTTASSFTSQTSRMWMFTSDGSSGNLYHAPVPDGSGPISLQIAGGSFTFNTTGRLYLSEQNWDDDTATAAIRRIDVRGRKVSATRTIAIKTRTGQPPETITDQSTWTTAGTATADATAIIPTTAVEGKGVAFQVVLTTPIPYTAAPVFRAISPRAKVIRETAQVFTLNVLLEKGTELKFGQQDLRKVSTLAGQIAGLQDRGEIPYTDQDGVSWYAMVEQGMGFRYQQVEDDWRAVLLVEVSLIRAA